MTAADAMRMAAMPFSLGICSCRRADRMVALRRPERWNGRLAVLVHGLAHRWVVLRNLGDFLRRRGYLVWLYDYSSWHGSLESHGRDLARRLEGLASEHRRSGTELDLVTHSMGGLLIRAAWPHASPGLRGWCGRAVMLAPPNRGSRAAGRALVLLPALRRLTPFLDELRHEPDSAANRLSWPEDLEVGVISGSRDWEVLPDEWPMPGVKDHWEAVGGHTFLMQRQAVWDQVARFLERGRFSCPARGEGDGGAAAGGSGRL